MNQIILLNALFSALISFLAVLWFMPYFMRYIKRIGIEALDQQKKGKPVLPTSGGIPTFIGFMLGLMIFAVALALFSLTDETLILKVNLSLFAAIISAGTLTVIGYFDDSYIVQKEVETHSDTVEKRVGLRQHKKALLTLLGAIPLVAVTTNVNTFFIPWLGALPVSLIYPLILVPLAVICVSNASNMLAGLNGLEAGLMAIASISLAFLSFLNESVEGMIISLTLFFSLLAFLRFNWFPSRILPGDSLTYFAGGAFVSAVILSRLEFYGIILFIPWIIEAFLKLRGRFSKRSFGDLQEDGTIKAPYEKIYSLTHVAMKLPVKISGKRLKENQLTGLILVFEAIIALTAISLFVL